MSQDSNIEGTPEFNHEHHRAKWLRKLVNELEKLESLMPIKFLPTGIEYPKWVSKIEHEFSLTMLPSAKLKEPNFKLTPKRMGALLGHACEMAVWMEECIQNQIREKSEKFEQEPIKEEEITVKDWELAAREIEKADKFYEGLSNWYQGLCRLAKRALASSVDQSYDDMKDFLLAYSDAFSRKPKTFQVGNIGNPTFEIYVFMMVYWRAINHMNSVRQLHATLISVFGAQRIGDQKRIEKICQRLGLSFRKVGRPKKIIQTPS